MNDDLRSFFEPSAMAFVRYVVSFTARYIFMCGGIYYLLTTRALGARYKIQPNTADKRIIRHEIIWSVSNTICTGLFVVLMYWFISTGRTKMYFDIESHGWLWFFLSIPLGTIGFDTWFYWFHRLLHRPFLFKHAHAIHHRSKNPTAFAAFTHHPLETFGEDLYFLLLICVIPMHPIAFGFMGLHAFVLGVLGHMGYEFFPRCFVRHRLLGLHNTGTHHNMHHSHVWGNYGLYFNWWDQLMKTNFKNYPDYFEAVVDRRRARASSPADTAPSPPNDSERQPPDAPRLDGAA